MLAYVYQIKLLILNDYGHIDGHIMGFIDDGEVEDVLVIEKFV